MECDYPEKNASNDEIKEILENYKTVAVVGLSTDPSKPSYRVAEYLKNNGYKIIPVNPGAKEILGEKSYPDLKSIPEKVEIVDIFRKPEAIPPVVDEAIKIGAKAVWMQLGLCHTEAAENARKAGLTVVMNKCIKIDHSMLI